MDLNKHIKGTVDLNKHIKGTVDLNKHIKGTVDVILSDSLLLELHFKFTRAENCRMCYP